MRAMTQARARTVAEGPHRLYHCVTRWVRRVLLCEVESLTLIASCAIIGSRRGELGTIIAVGINPYAVMSNHLHVVVSKPEAAAD